MQSSTKWNWLILVSSNWYYRHNIHYTFGGKAPWRKHHHRCQKVPGAVIIRCRNDKLALHRVEHLQLIMMQRNTKTSHQFSHL